MLISVVRWIREYVIGLYLIVVYKKINTFMVVEFDRKFMEIEISFYSSILSNYEKIS